MLSFGEDRWRDFIFEDDFRNENYPEDFPMEEEDTFLEGSYRFVTYDLTDEPLTDDAYRSLTGSVRENDPNGEELGFRTGEILGEIVLDAAKESFDYWINQRFDEPDPGRDAKYETHGTPFLQILDESPTLGEETAEFATQPANTVGYLKQRYEEREEFSPPENFLKGMDKVLFNAAYRE